MVEFLGVSATTFATMVVAWGAHFEFGVGGPLAEGEFNGSALLIVCRAVHVGLDAWPVD